MYENIQIYGTFQARRVIPACLAALAVLVAAGCSQPPQVREARFLELGKQQLRQKNYNAAIVQFKNAAQAMPKDAEPYYQLGMAYLATNDFSQAASFFRKTIELNPGNTGAQYQLAELMARNRGTQLLAEAEKQARNAATLLPESADALSLLAYTELRLGKAESAEAHLEEALRKSPSHLRSSVTLAKARLARGEVAGAEEALKQAAAQSPGSPEAPAYLGGLYLALGRTGDAEREFDRSLQLDRKFAPALVSLGALQARAGRLQQAEETYRALSALPEKRFRPIHALFLFQSGRRGEAVAEFERLFREDPADRAARTRLVDAYLTVQRSGDAEKLLAEALRRNPRDGDALLQRSRIELAVAKYAQAESDLKQALGMGTNPAETHYLLSKVRQARGETGGRRQELGEALRLEPAFLAARVELAQLLIDTRGADSALSLLDSAPPDQGKTVALLVQRNWALMALGRVADARRGVDEVLASGRVPEALVQDAALKMGRSDFPGARAAAEEALKRSPEDTRALRLLVESYTSAHQASAALERLREYASHQRGSAAVQNFLGQTLVAAGDREGARRALEAARANRPGWDAPQLALAELDLSEGRRQEARTAIAALLAANGGNLPARLFLARLEALDGRVEPAIEQYRKVLEIDGRNSLALNNLAYLLADDNRPGEALKYAQLAKELDPDNPAVDDTLGWTYFRNGLYPSAVQHLEGAVAGGATARRKYHLAMAYLKAGDPLKGRQTLDAALKMDPSLPEAETARQLLRAAPRP